MGGGGTSGAVSFPGYIMDTHGLLMADHTVDDQGDYEDFASPSGTTFDLFGVLDAAHGNDPYGSISASQATTVLAPLDTQFTSFYDQATGVATTSIEDLISASLDAVNVGNWTGDLKDINLVSSLPTASEASLPFDTASLDTSLSVITRSYNEIESLVPDVSTPNWTTTIQTAADKLRECGITEEAEMQAVISEAASQTEYLLEDAIGIAQRIASRQEVTDLVNDFATRRQETYQRQVSQFNAQMADGMATNSSAYMMGLALLKNQQGKQEAQFDKEITFQTFNRALDRYVESYAQTLDVAANIEVSNAQQYNQLLSDSVRGILEIKLRDWRRGDEISEADMLNLFGSVFNAQLEASLRTGELGVELERINAGVDQFNSQLKRDEEELNLEVDRFNKEAREQRFRQAMQGTLQLLTNRVEFEKAAADLKTEQKRIEFAARQETEAFEAELGEKSNTWDLNVLETGANILAAPQGMARSLPKTKSKAASAIGGALQGGAAGARSGGAAGAAIGAIAGGLGGYLNA